MSGAQSVHTSSDDTFMHMKLPEIRRLLMHENTRSSPDCEIGTAVLFYDFPAP